MTWLVSESGYFADRRKAGSTQFKQASIYHKVDSELRVFEKTMKRTRTVGRAKLAPEKMRREYRFDYSKGRPNRFAKQMASASPLVVVDSDVADVFSTAVSINRALSALISAVPGAKGKTAQR